MLIDDGPRTMVSSGAREKCIISASSASHFASLRGNAIGWDAPAHHLPRDTPSLLVACLLRKENQFCADCGAPKPAWCVHYPFGVCICIDCVGVHRQLWANKCQAVELDFWNEEDIQFMCRRGTAVVNQELGCDFSENEQNGQKCCEFEDEVDVELVKESKLHRGERVEKS